MSLNRLNRKQISDEVAYNYYEAAQKMKRETGKSVGDILLQMIYDPNTQPTGRALAIRVFYEIMTTILNDDQAEELLEFVEEESLKETH